MLVSTKWKWHFRGPCCKNLVREAFLLVWSPLDWKLTFPEQLFCSKFWAILGENLPPYIMSIHKATDRISQFVSGRIWSSACLDADVFHVIQLFRVWDAWCPWVFIPKTSPTHGRSSSICVYYFPDSIFLTRYWARGIKSHSEDNQWSRGTTVQARGLNSGKAVFHKSTKKPPCWSGSDCQFMSIFFNDPLRSCISHQILTSRTG